MRRLLVGLSAVSLAVAACAGDTNVDSAADSTDSPRTTSTTDSTTTTSITVPTTTTSTTEPPPEVKACGVPETFDPSIKWQIETVAEGVPDLPRHISCGQSGVYVYQRNSENVLFFNPEGEQGASLTGLGEPKGNESLVVFHTWDDIHFKTGSGDLEVLFDDSGADDAVPIGDSEILVTNNGKIAIYDLDGNERWSRDLADYGQAVKGGEAWWVADNDGKIYRVPLDGSDPDDAILIPRAKFPGKTPAHRPAPRVLPVAGGVWITNSDGTIQFIGDDRQLGETVKVASPAKSGGAHITDTQDVQAVGGYLYTGGFRMKVGGNQELEEVDATPLTVGGGFLWYLGNNFLTAKKQDTGEVGFQLPLKDPQGTRFAWAHGALWIADQNHTGGFVYRISPKD